MIILYLTDVFLFHCILYEISMKLSFAYVGNYVNCVVWALDSNVGFQIRIK